MQAQAILNEYTLLVCGKSELKDGILLRSLLSIVDAIPMYGRVAASDLIADLLVSLDDAVMNAEEFTDGVFVPLEGPVTIKFRDGVVRTYEVYSQGVRTYVGEPQNRYNGSTFNTHVNARGLCKIVDNLVTLILL